MISNASYKNKEVRFIDDKVFVRRGELVFPLRKNAEIWGIPYSNMRNFIDRLKRKRMIETRKTTIKPQLNHKYGSVTVISICNYDKFQAQAEVVNHLPTKSDAILNNITNTLTNISKGLDKQKDDIIGSWGNYNIIVRKGKKFYKHKWKNEPLKEEM
ncbi:MAG: hypothetical protein VW810_00480 [Pelagibacteraceae bacterium]